MANAEHIRVVLGGPLSLTAWHVANPDQSLDLSGANLEGALLLGMRLTSANLEGANLQHAGLMMSSFQGASLDHADLSDANLSAANLGSASCKGANLYRADLFDANLKYGGLDGANLKESNLAHARFHACSLKGTDFDGALFSWSILSGLDLTEPLSLTRSVHEGGSHVDVATLFITLGSLGNHWSEDVTTFLRNTGISQELLDALSAISAGLEYHPAFVSYGEPDVAMAEKLVTDLRERGVSCWVYKLDSTPGESTWREISQKRSEADKFIVLCSAAALIRPTVLKEIEEQIDDDPEKIVPVSLDDLWSEEGFRT